MTGIDKKAVRQSFSHAALAYTDAAVMQHQIALRLVALTDHRSRKQTGSLAFWIWDAGARYSRSILSIIKSDTLSVLTSPNPCF